MARGLLVSSKRDHHTVGDESHGSGDLEELVSLLRQHLYLPDPAPFFVSLGTVLANRLGLQVWLMLVGPPSCGGTEILQTVYSVRGLRSVTRFSVGGLLSGVSAKEKSKDAKGGLLLEMEDGDTLLVKDFTGILQSKQGLDDIMGALRDIADGEYSRDVGTDGGKHLGWRGSIGFLAKSTPVIDQHAETMSIMGDRFIYYRYPPGDPEMAARMRLRAYDWDRKEIADPVGELVEAIEERVAKTGLPKPNGDEQERLVACASLAAVCRAGVRREYKGNRAIENIEDAEGPSRIAGNLLGLWAAFTLVGLPKPEVWRLIRHITLGTMPSHRSMVLRAVIKAVTPIHLGGQGLSGVSFNQVAAAYGKGKDTMLRRGLEELEAFNVLTIDKPGPTLIGSGGYVSSGGLSAATALAEGRGVGRPSDTIRPSAWLKEKLGDGWK